MKRKFDSMDTEAKKKYLEQLLAAVDEEDEDAEEEYEEDAEESEEEEESDEAEDSEEAEDDEAEESEDEDEAEESDEASDDEDEYEDADEDGEESDEAEDGEVEEDEEEAEDDGEEAEAEAEDEEVDEEEAEEPSWEKGTRVICQIEDYAYLGTITKIVKGAAKVTFDDGDKQEIAFEDILGEGQDEEYDEAIPMKSLKKYLAKEKAPEKPAKKKAGKKSAGTEQKWESGMRVLASIEDEIYLGTVSKVLSGKLKITFDDGDELNISLDNIVGVGRDKPYKKAIGEDELDNFRGEVSEGDDEGEDEAEEPEVNPAIEKAVEKFRAMLEVADEHLAEIKSEGPYQPKDMGGLNKKDRAAVYCLYGIFGGTDDEKLAQYKKAMKAGVKPKLPSF